MHGHPPHAHSHSHTHPPVAASLLLAGAAPRLLIVALAAALIWAACLWALWS